MLEPISYTMQETQLGANVRSCPILLQKSQIAEQQFFRQKTKQAVIGD
jgi:hypothetical protein